MPTNENKIHSVSKISNIRSLLTNSEEILSHMVNYTFFRQERILQN